MRDTTIVSDALRASTNTPPIPGATVQYGSFTSNYSEYPMILRFRFWAACGPDAALCGPTFPRRYSEVIYTITQNLTISEIYRLKNEGRTKCLVYVYFSVCGQNEPTPHGVSESTSWF